MDDQARVGVLNGVQHGQEKPQAITHAQPGGLRRIGDAAAIDKGHRQPGLIAIGTGIQNRRDVRVVQGGKDAAFTFKALHQGARGVHAVRQLQRHLALMRTVGTARQPDAGHAALAQFTQQQPGADLLTRRPSRPRR